MHRERCESSGDPALQPSRLPISLLSDAMRVAEDQGRMRFFGIRHEGAAAFAASAYGKLTGELAGCGFISRLRAGG